MNIYEQKQDMKKAFEVYLKECCGINNDVSIYNTIIEECLKEKEEGGIPLSYNEIDEKKELIEKIIDDPQYKERTKPIIYDETEDNSENLEGKINYTEALEKYRDFLTSYKFFEKWSLPSELRVENEEIGKNTIVFGAPGTGKSHYIKEYIKKVTGIENDEDQPKTRITFHPDSDYASFVGCYKPIKEGNDLTYKFVPQAFTKAYVKAWMTDSPHFLVIEEINRGNCAQIFGDIFQLLDRKNGVSEYPIDADEDLKDFLKSKLVNSTRSDIPEKVKNGDELIIPENLLILATMNTSDQSLYPMDSAFKRRWDWKYIPFMKGDSENYIVVDDSVYKWSDFLEITNEKIKEVTQSEDKQLGFWFVKAEQQQINISTFVNKVLFYLWNDIFKDSGDTSFFGELTFQSFFMEDGRPYLVKIKDFLENRLKLAQVQVDVTKLGQKEGSSSKTRRGKFVVRYNDSIIDESTAGETFVKAIKAIGPMRVKESFASYFSTDRNKFIRSTEVEDGLYLNINFSNDDKEKLLNKIKEKFSLELNVER